MTKKTLSDGNLVICGGCNAKIAAGTLGELLADLPKSANENLLVGYEHSDDAAVIKLTEDLAIIQTLDFFPTMVSDPYLFGKIAAANALSDVYAMGGEVLSALNIVCFPEEGDLNILHEILRGGAEKVLESGGVLAGGHSIHDATPKYGLSVSGTIHPDRILTNNDVCEGDVLVLTKPLGVGITTTAYSIGEAPIEAFEQATQAMETLNKYACEVGRRFPVRGCTDVTGFGLLGHLTEMLGSEFSATIYAEFIPYIPFAYEGAKEFLINAGGQRNRNSVGDQVDFQIDDFAMEEILFDPQTSGGLLFSIGIDESQAFLSALNELPIKSAIIGEVTKRQHKTIIVL